MGSIFDDQTVIATPAAVLTSTWNKWPHADSCAQSLEIQVTKFKVQMF